MILLNEVERELLTTKGRILGQRLAELRRVAEKANAEFNEAVSMVVKGRPMRERPPVEAQVSYDEEQGALVWAPAEELPALPPAPEPQPATAEA